MLQYMHLYPESMTIVDSFLHSKTFGFLLIMWHAQAFCTHTFLLYHHYFYFTQLMEMRVDLYFRLKDIFSNFLF